MSSSPASQVGKRRKGEVSALLKGSVSSAETRGAFVASPTQTQGSHSGVHFSDVVRKRRQRKATRAAYSLTGRGLPRENQERERNTVTMWGKMLQGALDTANYKSKLGPLHAPQKQESYASGKRGGGVRRSSRAKN